MSSNTDESADEIEQLISKLRDLADEASEKADQRKEETDMSGLNPSQMAVAELDGMQQAFQQAWALAIDHRSDSDE
jgi:hypothetical protein